MTYNTQNVFSPSSGGQSLRSKCQQGYALSKGSKGGSFLPLPASGGPTLQPLPPSSRGLLLCVPLFPCRLSNLPLRRTTVIGFRVHPGNQDKLLVLKSLITSSKALFLNKVSFSGLRSGRGQYPGGHCSAHCSWWLAMSYCSKHHLVYTPLCAV